MERYEKGYQKCQQERRYEETNPGISKDYFTEAQNDIESAKEELEKEKPFWALEKLHSAATLFIYGISIKNRV